MEFPSERRFRLSAKAIIVEDDSLLTIHCRGDDGDFYYLPGGGQEIGETVTDALKRECLEEINCRVEPGPLLFVRDYMGWNHEFVDLDASTHQVELMFRATIVNGDRPGAPTVPDGLQIGFAWLNLNDLPTTRFYPQTMRTQLVEAVRSNTREATYLGAVN